MSDLKQKTEKAIEKKLGLDVELDPKDENGRCSIIVEGEDTKAICQKDVADQLLEFHGEKVFDHHIASIVDTLKLELDQFDFSVEDLKS